MSITPEQAQAMIAEAVEKSTAPLMQTIQALSASRSEPAPAPAPAPAEPPTYTRAQLEAATREGKITESEANALWDKQQADQTARLIATQVEQRVGDVTRKAAVESQISEYQALKPDVMKEGSSDRQRAKQQYDYLVSIGQPANKATELAALAIVYGPLEALKRAHGARSEAETHQETGGGRSSGGSDAGSDGPKTKLSDRERQHYQRLIDRGMYKDWAAVDKEMEYANDHVRRIAKAKNAA